MSEIVTVEIVIQDGKVEAVLKALGRSGYVWDVTRVDQ